MHKVICFQFILIILCVFAAFPAEAGRLHNAARTGDLEQVKLLVERGVRVNLRNVNRQTPLHFAAKKGHTAIARFLIAKGADIHARSKYGDTPLHEAAKSYGGTGLDIARMLIKKGADVNAKNRYGFRPLHFAKRSGNQKIIALLEKHGAKE